MDSEVDDLNNSAYSVKNDEEADNIIEILKSQLKHYKTKTDQNDKILAKLKLTVDSLNFTSRDTLNKLASLQEASGVENLEVNDVGMSFLENMEAKHKYETDAIRLKGHFENLSVLTEKIEKETENFEKELDLSKTKIDSLLPITQSELQKAELQIKTYEANIVQYIEKYPWINQPEYNLLSIQEEIKKFYRFKHEKQKLLEEIECYQGLKPDLYTAQNQLESIKAEYQRIWKLITENDANN